MKILNQGERFLAMHIALFTGTDQRGKDHDKNS